MDNVIELAATNNSISIIKLITDATLVVQLVMLVLLLASVVSWTMIFKKWFSFRSLENSADDFEDEFWSGGDLNRLYHGWAGRNRDPEGMASIFVAGFREFTRLSDKPNVERAHMVDGVHRSMRVAMSREVDNLEFHLSFLATVGSTSPYIGLFGTVWGIMNSFQAIAAMQQATIATVAPGIAEALVATAMVLFAAIPAVIAYNRFANSSDRLSNRYEVFVEEFLSIVNRQTFHLADDSER